MQRVRMNDPILCNPETEKPEDRFDQLMRSWLREKTDTASRSTRDPDESWTLWGDL
jgi:hypothetical protein